MAQDATGYAERFWRCSCHGDHFLCLTEWGDGTGDVHLGGDFRATGRLPRLRLAWEVLRHGHADAWVELTLDRDKALQVRSALRDFAEGKHIRAQGNDSQGLREWLGLPGNAPDEDVAKAMTERAKDRYAEAVEAHRAGDGG